MIRRVAAPAKVRSLADDEVEVIVSTDNLVAQDGLLLEPAGCVLDNYRRNPIWLWSHDPTQPIGRAQDIRVSGDALRARVKFAPTGISPKADEIRGLVKSGVVSGVSVGFDFDQADTEAVEPHRPQAGKRVKRWELFECSFVSVPADPDALVTARAAREAAGLPAEALRELRAALAEHDSCAEEHRVVLAHHRRCGDIVRSVLRGDRGDVPAGIARSLGAALDHHDEALNAHLDAADEHTDARDILARTIERAVPAQDDSKQVQTSAGVTQGLSAAHGAYAAIFDPSTPPHIRAELRAARDVAARAGIEPALANLDFERRQAEVRRLRDIHEGRR